MRKLLLTAAFASAVAFGNAQTMTSKEGTPILPESGDWSISIDAAPLGTLFRNSGSSAFTNQYLQNMTIIGKMMTSATSAFRGKVRIGFGSTSEVCNFSAARLRVKSFPCHLRFHQRPSSTLPSCVAHTD